MFLGNSWVIPLNVTVFSPLKEFEMKKVITLALLIASVAVVSIGCDSTPSKPASPASPKKA